VPAGFLAFDLGASSGRALLGEMSGDRLAVRELHRFPNGIIEIAGHLHWDLFRLLEHVKSGLRACAVDAGIRPESVGIDTWGVDFGLLDEKGQVLGLPFAYRDSRTRGAMESFFSRLPRERVYELTGIQLLELNSLFQLESMVRDGSPLLSRAQDLLFMPDLFHYLLADVRAAEFTFATTSQMYNPTNGGWDSEILGALGLPESLMQDVVQPGTVLGAIGPKIGAETGLGKVPLVAVATHDTGSAIAAVPAEGRGWAYISSGTWSLMGIESDRPIITDRTRDLNITNEGGVGRTFRVLKNISGLWLVQECRRAWASETDLSYAELTAAAGEAEPFGSLLDPDHPDFMSPDDMPQAIADYCRRTGQAAPDTRGAYVRCILDSLALKYRFVLDQLRQISEHDIDRIHIIGGGSQNELLCRLTADATGLDVLAGPVEATAIGNLLVQAMAVGRIDSLEELRQVVRSSFESVAYRPRHTKEWEAAYGRFSELLEQG